MSMAKLDKGTLALTFKFDCDRFLRFRLASKAELDVLGVSDDKYKRPGIELITAAGRRWEADKYQDLIDSSPQGTVEFLVEDSVDSLLGRKPFKKIRNIFDILRREEPPQAVIEAEFKVPTDITPGLQTAYDDFGLEQVCARPDILWIRKGGTGKPLIGNPTIVPEYEIHIIDVKMAAEPSLRHFTEVTYYALALAKAIEQENLNTRYAVSAEGMIWPGCHDTNEFRNLVLEYRAEIFENPVAEALEDTLISVPYEVYEVHVRQFFEDRLLRVLQTEISDTNWHVSSKCQLCDYVHYCTEKAADCDHLSRLAWINQGQAELLRSFSINTTNDLTEAVENQDDRWLSVIESSHQFRAEGLALYTRARSLSEGVPIPIEGRRTTMMPSWTDQSIFITIHFDPGSGISFALGAARIFFPHNRIHGDPPITEEKVFIVDRVDAMNPETERERLKEFAGVVSEWMEEISTINSSLQANQRLSSHIFFWNSLEVRQLKRMLERHMQHPDVVELIETLIRFFPPEDLLPDPDAFKSQPGTIVKEVMRVLVGLPVVHDYSIFDSANCFYPNTRDDGTLYKFQLPFGFSTPMSDQIPFERAYELWQDKIFIRRFNNMYPNDPTKWKRYTRDELYEEIKYSTKVHLRALQHIVRRLREQYRDCLILKKSGFCSAASSQAQVPEAARSLITFEKLNVACQDIDNRNIRALPVDEREAKFFSIRGLKLKDQVEADNIIKELRSNNPEFLMEVLYVFNFSPTSRDSRIKEGEFTIAISNEDHQIDLDEPWNKKLGLSYQEAKKLLADSGLFNSCEIGWFTKCSLSRLLEIQVVKLEAMRDTPYIVIKPGHQNLFQFALDNDLISLDSPLVLDPLYKDFSSKRIESVLRTVGGQSAPIKRRRRRLNNDR